MIYPNPQQAILRIVKMKTFKKIATTSCFVIMGLSLGSCELLGPKPVAKLPLTPVAKEQPDKQPDVVFKDLQNKPPVNGYYEAKE